MNFHFNLSIPLPRKWKHQQFPSVVKTMSKIFIIVNVQASLCTFQHLVLQADMIGQPTMVKLCIESKGSKLRCKANKAATAAFVKQFRSDTNSSTLSTNSQIKFGK